MSDLLTPLHVASHLIQIPSQTPHDLGCQLWFAEQLRDFGFHCETMRFGEVDNLWAQLGTAQPLLVLAGHTDVVPTGPLEQWSAPPYAATVKQGVLYGRGAADMKGGLAAQLCAVQRFLTRHPVDTLKGSLAFLITSDEEGDAINGTAKVVETLQQRHQKMDWCLIAEPSSSQRLGDTIKIGRRGSLHGQLTITGVQGHVAYPHLVKNPIHALGGIISQLANEVWDHGNAFFPPTSFQISNIHGGTGTFNVVPHCAEITFNFRFSTAITIEQLQQRTSALIQAALDALLSQTGYLYSYQLNWTQPAGLPFLTEPGPLSHAVDMAVQAVTGQKPQHSTDGGTSDGRFIAPTGTQVIELGHINASIHKIDEQVLVDDLEKLCTIYEHILEQLLL